jgi:two-component system, NtrC family, sensor kinase
MLDSSSVRDLTVAATVASTTATEIELATALLLKDLQKERRTLTKKLERSEADRLRLEEINRNKESLLKQVIVELQSSQDVLEKKGQDLERALGELEQTQSQLIESEKLAALGRLVAGVAHEINTPIGTGITLASTLADETKLFGQAIAEGALKRSVLNHYLHIATESSQLMLSNLNRAADLVHNFKQVAVDQTRLELRQFDVRSYLESVMVSLSPQLRQTGHVWSLSGDECLVIQSYPGVLAQIITNLVTNSLIHGYAPGEAGTLKLHISRDADLLLLDYRDNGCGIPIEHQSQVFEPFFTTARNRGGTGLGLSIIYNLISHTLHGDITMTSDLGQGVRFQIRIPLEQPAGWVADPGVIVSLPFTISEGGMTL